MLVVREFRFEAAHHLPDHPGKCRNPHGHSYRLQVACAAAVDRKSGMALDFGELKRIVYEVLEDLDHRDLNELLPVPSAELIVAWIWGRLTQAGLPVYELTLWETANCWVVYRGEDLDQAAP